MIDIHNHLIFGVDDGPESMAISLAMASEAAVEGVTRIVCTPHANEQFPYNKALIEERFAELKYRLERDIELSLGCELHLTADNVFEAREHPLRYSMDDHGYLLVEFGDQSIPSQMFNALSTLEDAGYTVIVAHPERYPEVARRPELIAMWMRRGCLMQVTAGSLYGRFGRTAESLANEMLDRNWIHFVASDAHDVKWRPPHLKKSYEYIANRAGEETAHRLLVTNPAAAVSGEQWPQQPEPEGLLEHIPLNVTTSKPPIRSQVTNLKDGRSTYRRKGLLERLFHGVQY